MASHSLQALLSQQIQTLQTRKGLLVLGLQNDFTSADGKLPIRMSAEFWPGLRTLVPAFREFGHVVWVRTEFDGTGKSAGIIGSSGKVDYDDQCDNDGPCETDAKSNDDKNCEDEEHRDDRDSPVPTKRQRTSLDESNSMPTLDAIDRALGQETSARDTFEAAVDEEFFFSQTQRKEACCLRDSWGAELCSDAGSLVNDAIDLQATTNSYSAFDTGSLLTSLRSKLVTELYICGCPTNSSVYATAMDAARYGFGINLVEDCLAARSTELNDTTITQLCDVLEAEAMTSAEALELLRNPPRESDGEYESEEVSEYDDEEVESGAGRLRGGGAILVADDDSSVSAQSLGDPGGDVSPILVSTRPHSSHLDKGFQDLHFSLIAAHKSLEGEEYFQETPHVSESDGLVGPTSGVQNGDSDDTAPAEHPHELERINICGESQLADLEHTSAPDGLASLESREEIDVYQFIRNYLHSRQSPTAASKHPGLNALSPVCRLCQKTVDQFEDMMKQARGPHLQPLFGEGKEVESNGSTISFDLLPSEIAETVFDTLKQEISWQKMYHQSGEVPRLVCCQGSIGEDGSKPVYRHPSDQTLPSDPWTPMVNRIRRAAEEQIGHPLNHALIQFYRSGTDYISEHSDKTLDITKGTCIVNVSFGAQRTMRLRTKRVQGSDPTQAPGERTTHRVPMPHNSMIKMTLATNAQYLHGINADKRPALELGPAERAYEGARISLTFRNIGTYLDADSSHIWGQGATGKTHDCARLVINGDAEESERLIRAFGAENQATVIQWDTTYGGGSNVLHLKPVAAVEQQTS